MTRGAYVLFYRQRTHEPLFPLITTEQSNEDTISSKDPPNTDTNSGPLSAAKENISSKHPPNTDINPAPLSAGDKLRSDLPEKELSDTDDLADRGDNSDNSRQRVYKDLGYTDMDAVD